MLCDCNQMLFMWTFTSFCLTYLHQAYYEKKKRKQLAASRATHNNGYDDANYDLILRQNEVFLERYELVEKIGKVRNIFIQESR